MNEGKRKGGLINSILYWNRLKKERIFDVAGHTKDKFVFVPMDDYMIDGRGIIHHHKAYERPTKFNGKRELVADIYSYPSDSKPHWYFVIPDAMRKFAVKLSKEEHSYKTLKACKEAIRDCFDLRRRPQPTFKEAK